MSFPLHKFAPTHV